MTVIDIEMYPQLKQIGINILREYHKTLHGWSLQEQKHHWDALLHSFVIGETVSDLQVMLSLSYDCFTLFERWTKDLIPQDLIDDGSGAFKADEEITGGRQYPYPAVTSQRQSTPKRVEEPKSIDESYKRMEAARSEEIEPELEEKTFNSVTQLFFDEEMIWPDKIKAAIDRQNGAAGGLDTREHSPYLLQSEKEREEAAFSAIGNLHDLAAALPPLIIVKENVAKQGAVVERSTNIETPGAQIRTQRHGSFLPDVKAKTGFDPSSQLAFAHADLTILTEFDLPDPLVLDTLWEAFGEQLNREYDRFYSY